jgi:hypothetical protein
MEDLLVALLQGLVEILAWLGEGAWSVFLEASDWDCAIELIKAVLARKVRASSLRRGPP